MSTLFRALIIAVILGLFAASAPADGLIVITEPVVIDRPHHPAFAPLHIRKHLVEVKIDDQVAVTSVDQTFYNPSDQRLEGTYIFPLPEGGQVDQFTMDINGVQVKAELLDAAKARAIYEEIVRKTRDPALMEYAGRGLFRVRIFPIEPRSEKRVTLKYTQILKSDNGLITYSYPLNTEKFSPEPIPRVAIKCEVKTKRPLMSIHSPSHNIEIKRHGENAATVGFEAKDVRPDTDFQLLFAPRRDKGDIAVNLLTFASGDAKPQAMGGSGGYFMLLASPGALADQAEVAAKDVVFVVDTSGSMSGEKIKQAQKALLFCVNSLNADDRFEVIRFSTEAEPLFKALVAADGANRDKAKAFIDTFSATGGTAIDDALQAAAKAIVPGVMDGAIIVNGVLEKTPNPIALTANRPRYIIFLTDGQPTIGERNEDAIVDRVTKAVGDKSVRVFCFGVGNDINTHLLDKITQKTRASSQYVLPSEDIEVKVSNFYARINQPVLTGLTLSFGDNIRTTRMYPTTLPDLFKGDQLVLFGEYTGSGPTAVTLEGFVNGEKKKLVSEATFTEKSTEYGFIPRLWATRRIGYLLEEIRLHGETKELKDETADLARKYGIVTPYTSYLIVEDERKRDVPMPLRTSAAAPAAVEGLGRQYEEFKSERSGNAAPGVASDSSGSAGWNGPSGGVKASKATRALQQAQTLSGNAPTSATDDADAHLSGGARGKDGDARVRYIRGRAFYTNGDKWIDQNVQKQKDAKPIVVKFGSDEYFKLLKDYPDASAWLSIGKKVRLVLGDKVYEVVDEE